MPIFEPWHNHKKPTKILKLCCHELLGKLEEHEGKKYFITDDMFDKVLDKMNKMIGIEKLNNATTFTDTDDKLPDNIALKNAVMLVSCFMKNGDKFYSPIFLEAL